MQKFVKDTSEQLIYEGREEGLWGDSKISLKGFTVEGSE
jgi:hypothetical protein